MFVRKIHFERQMADVRLQLVRVENMIHSHNNWAREDILRKEITNLKATIAKLEG